RCDCRVYRHGRKCPPACAGGIVPSRSAGGSPYEPTTAPVQASRLHDGTNFNHFLVFPALLAQTVRTSRPLLNSPPAAKLFAFCAPRFAQVFRLAHDGDAGWASWPLSSATPEQRRERAYGPRTLGLPGLGRRLVGWGFGLLRLRRH